MTRINLLPWREQLREQRKKQFVINWSAASVGTLLIMGMLSLIMNHKVKQQDEVNQFLRKEITVLDGKIARVTRIRKVKKSLMSRISVIQQLQAHRPANVHLFEEIVKSIPEGVYLSEMKRKGRQVNIVGEAESNTRISSLMRKVDKSKWLSSPLLTEIKTNEQTGKLGSKQFEMQLMQGMHTFRLGQ